MKKFSCVRQIVTYETVEVEAESVYDARDLIEGDSDKIKLVDFNEGDWEIYGPIIEVKE